MCSHSQTTSSEVPFFGPVARGSAVNEAAHGESLPRCIVCHERYRGDADVCEACGGKHLCDTCRYYEPHPHGCAYQDTDGSDCDTWEPRQ